ncbi:cobyric acid synthase [Thermocladium modestius]|uniref:Probable cobyric acid synthase n=1 Tax=Thermocladium modestius TaxID=62609 RepID=A0A830GRL3_9CREN|nr:cobyric acid synthase [Thermocladium modestius]GGP18958.1 cobyric acid synthase [Thermocladium modestius]
MFVLSTSSNSGKTVIVTAIARVLSRRARVAPFKAQNMSLNSYPAVDGGEVAVAQAMQAYAAGVEPSTAMNPILLKPLGDDRSEVIVRGRPAFIGGFGEYSSSILDRWRVVRGAVDELRSGFDLVVGEGAGSAFEPNIRDVANFRAAEYLGGGAYVVLDIERGGAFTSALGLMASIPPRWRGLVRGFIINKFRGEEGLLDGAVRWLEERTGRRVVGVIPWMDVHKLWPEDSESMEGFGSGPLDVAVIAYPWISNFNEFQPLSLEPDVGVRFVRGGSLGEPDLIILPGSRNVPASLEWLRRTGLEAQLRRALGSSLVLGVCGGFQLMAARISDPLGVEGGAPGHYRGLGLGDFEVVYAAEKVVSRSRAQLVEPVELEFRGYEIHRGRVSYGSARPSSLIVERNGSRVEVLDGVWDEALGVAGTHLHGALGDPGFRELVLNEARRRRGLPQRRSGGGLIDALLAGVDEVARVVRDRLDLDWD